MTVTVSGYRYEVVPVETGSVPQCTGCGAAPTGPWRIGRALDLTDPDRCGQPKKDGSPCGWIITREPCRVHRSPEELRYEEERRQAEEARRVKAEEQRRADTAARRENLIEMLSVTCPHCSAPAATLCRMPKGHSTRALHRARRQLAGVDGPKDYVVEATSWFTPRVAEPPLNDDPRTVLNHPLQDRTEQARERYATEQRAAAQHKMDEAHRTMWMAEAGNEDRVRARTCPRCGATAQERCVQPGRPHRKFHPERVDDAMQTAGTSRELVQ
ncbi:MULTISPECIES: zinc finger domain-containing protein [unclassified Streptomyces]|uniref:zinc finger domain-containing protein n=1 Tax=unclassified Streptomyces TaxID=2593676 RepID=UPI003BB81518